LADKLRGVSAPRHQLAGRLYRALLRRPLSLRLGVSSSGSPQFWQTLNTVKSLKTLKDQCPFSRCGLANDPELEISGDYLKFWSEKP
jgi:hypothetical protein